MRVSPEKMKVTLQHKPPDRLYSFVCFTATMTHILTQKVPRMPLGACIVTSAESLYMLTDKEPLLSSDSRRCGWIIYGGIPTHWLRKRHTTAVGRKVVKGCTRVSGDVFVCLRFFVCLKVHIERCVLVSTHPAFSLQYVLCIEFLILFFIECHNVNPFNKWKREKCESGLLHCLHYSFSLCWVAH